MKKLTIIFAILFLVILVIIFQGKSNKTQNLETQENNEGPVSLKVTPKDLWNFEVSLDTHSEELSEDLVAVSDLVDDQGKSHKPTSWEGAPPGGHHREGILKFNPISPRPKSLELKIKNVGGVPERSFKWGL